MLFSGAVAAAWSDATSGKLRNVNLNAITIAVAVLGCVGECHHPNQADVEALQNFAPELADLPPDELACEVIYQAVKRLAALRKARLAVMHAKAG